MDIIVGIDVSKDRLDVAVAASGTAFFVENSHAGIDDLAQRLKEMHADIVALEATGGFETLAVAKLSSAGFSVIVVNPAQVRAYANAIGRRAKTDTVDAAVIAAFVSATKPQIRPLRDQQTQLLSALVDRRRQIVQMIVAEENRLRMALEKATRKSILRLLAALRREVDSIDAEMDDHIRKSPVWRVRETLLTSVPGVGPATARTLLAEMPDGQSRPASDRLSRRPCSLDPAIGQMERQELHRWRQGQGPGSAVHGSACGGTLQSSPQGLSRSSRGSRKAENRRYRRNHAKASDNAQRHHQR